MKISNFYLVMIFIFTLLSCQKDVESTDYKDDLMEENYSEEVLEIEDFSIESIDASFGNVKSFLYDGPSLGINIKIKNNTLNKIHEFTIFSVIELKFELEDKIFYYPFEISETKSYTNDYLISLVKKELEKDDIWLPNTDRTFSYLVPYYIVNDPFHNFPKEIFKRTPESINLIIKYKAIGIDGEYEEVLTYDIIDLWKKYQEELGIR